MAFWVTHLMIADKILKIIPQLDRRGFAVGNIAPDCNIPNSDWSAFTPPRKVTHFMSGVTKQLSDSDSFAEKYLINRKAISNEQYSFLLGYYTHLVVDAMFYDMIHNEERLKNALHRVAEKYGIYEKNKNTDMWTLIKEHVPKNERDREIRSMEAEYLKKHPDSAYITQILTLDDFPDYIDILPSGSIVNKIRIMGYMPSLDDRNSEPVTISREEYRKFVDDAVMLTVSKFKEKAWLQ